LRRINFALSYSERSIYGPTKTQIRSFEIAKIQFGEIELILKEVLIKDIPSIEKALISAGAPFVE